MGLKGARGQMVDRLIPVQSLPVNGEIVSNNGLARLVFQGDGNLVLYVLRDGSWEPHWDSGTWRAPQATQCVMQGDGNLVLYAAGGRPVWASNTAGNPSAFLVLQDDENVVIYANGKALWSSDTWVSAPVRAPFDHARQSFHFVNNFPDSECFGVKAPGLCGGMTWSAFDYILRGRSFPVRSIVPPMNTQLGQYIYNRQMDSVKLQLVQWGTQIVNPNDQALYDWSTNDEWVKLRNAINRGKPAPIGLGCFIDVAKGHQVLATGYRDGKKEKWIYCLDPNAPLRESTIHLRFGGRHWYLNGGEYRGFFVAEVYSPSTPPARVGVEGDTAVRPSVFDAGFYLNLYADLRDAFGATNWAAAQSHWLNNGIMEGRRAVSVLDPVFYLRYHRDLVAAFGPDDFDSAIAHWINNGLGEGRRSSLEFDVAWYLSNHSDLVAAFGANNYAAAVNHWLTYGIREGRRTSADFYVGYYLQAYPDLQAAFGANNYAAAFAHWITFGKKEGRKPIP